MEKTGNASVNLSVDEYVGQADLLEWDVDQSVADIELDPELQTDPENLQCRDALVKPFVIENEDKKNIF